MEKKKLVRMFESMCSSDSFYSIFFCAPPDLHMTLPPSLPSLSSRSLSGVCVCVCVCVCEHDSAILITHLHGDHCYGLFGVNHQQKSVF